MMGKFSVAAHHIVALTDAAAEPARQVLRKLDINLNGFENGVYLCMKVDTCIEGAVHVGRHSAEYYELVNKTITEAYHNASPKNRRQAVINALDDIARRLMKDDFPL